MGRRSVLADEINALFYVGHIILPLVFVFDRDVTLEILFLEFVQNPFDVADPLAIRDVMGFTEIALVLEVAAHNATLEHTNTVNGAKTGSLPMAGIRASSNPQIAILDDG